MPIKLGTVTPADLKGPITVSYLAMISVPLSMNFGVLDSVVFATYLAINAFLGAYTYILMSNKRFFHFAELIGLGIAMGTALPALCNFLIRLTGIPIGSSAPVFPIIVGLILIAKRSRGAAVKIEIQMISNVCLCMILAAPVLAIVAWSDRMWPFCAVLVVAIASLSKFERQSEGIKYVKYLPWLMFIAGALINTATNSLMNRGLIWRSQFGVDIAFDEAQSWSVSRFGIYDNVFLAGHPTKGHILTQAWAGDFASFTNAPKFITTAMTGYGIGVLGLTALLYFLTYEMSNKKIAARIAILLFLAQASIPEQFVSLPSPRVANSLSMLWLIVFWFIYTSNQGKITRNSAPIFIVALFVVTLAKFQWGMLAALTIAIAAITQKSPDKGLFARIWKPAALLSTLPITYLLFLKGMDARDAVAFKLQVGMLPLLVVVLLTRTSLSRFMRTDSEQLRLFRSFYVSSTVFAVVLIWITNAGNQATYFLYPVLWMSASYLGIRIHRIFAEKHISKNRILFPTFWGFCSGIFICVSYYFLYNRLVNNSRFQVLQWIYVSHPEIMQVFASILLLVSLILITVFSSRSQPKSRPALASVLISALLVFNVSANFVNWILSSNASSITKIWFDVNNSPDYANNPDQFKVADWIINNTRSSEIGASNFLCNTKIEPGERTPSLNIGSVCKDRNMLPWISALTHRRMIIDAPLTSLMGSGGALEEEFRVIYNSAITFGSVADAESLEILKKKGVTWFVVDREQTDLTSWLPFAEIVYSSSRYFVLTFSI
jgi:hypothetical protein